MKSKCYSVKKTEEYTTINLVRFLFSKNCLILLIVLFALMLNISFTTLCDAKDSIPLISSLLVKPTKLLRPQASDTYLAHLEFDYFDNEADIKKVSITTIYPNNEKENNIFNAATMNVKGTKGKAYFQVAFTAENQLGDYKYIFRLVDSQNNMGKERTINVTLQDKGDPQLAIFDITPKTGQPGDHIKLSGNGFDISPLVANNVVIAGIVAEIIDVTSNTIVFEVPENVISGPITVTNKNGVTFSKFNFLTKPSIRIYNNGQRSLAPLQKTSLKVILSGIQNQKVKWYVNRIHGGSPKFGTIDKKGTFTAPATPPKYNLVEISAISLEDKNLRANLRIAITDPLPLEGSGNINAKTGGRIQDVDGLLVLNIPANTLKEDLTIKTLRTKFVYTREGLTGIPKNSLPIAKVYVETSKTSDLILDAKFKLLLPIWTSHEIKHGIMIRKGSKFVKSNVSSKLVVSENGDYLSGYLKILSNKSEFVIIRHYAPTFSQTSNLDGSLEITNISTPVPIEEGRTLPVLIEGNNFWPGYTRVMVADPEIEQYFSLGTTFMSDDGKQLGFTLRIHPIQTLERNDILPLSFRIERLAQNGFIEGSIETDPNAFEIIGLPEIIVSPIDPDESNNLFTVDGQHIDKVLSASDNGRYSTLEVKEGAVLGIGLPVSNVEAGGLSWDLNTVDAFENCYGLLDWVTNEQRTGNSLKFFQPENRLVKFDITGLVQIDGTIYFAGMHGGENPRMDYPSGPGVARLGGFASNTLSGGKGGDGGITDDETTQDGHRAGGNNTPDLGVGRGAFGGRPTSNSSLLLPLQPAGFGSRFDSITIDLFDYIKNRIQIVMGLGDVVQGAIKAFNGDIEGILDSAKEIYDTAGGIYDTGEGIYNITTEVPNLPTTASLESGQIVAGQGGHGGLRPSGISPDLEADLRIIPGSGGGGGGGGGSSFYEEELIIIPLNTVKEKGGAGAGGGGAAGSLRITAGSEFNIGINGIVNGIGGRGGFGEPHRYLGSPGGGGGGGCGGIAKLQAPRLFNRGTIALSGGARSGSIVAENSMIVPDENGMFAQGRIQVLGGIQKGGFLYYGVGGIHKGRIHLPKVNVAWPTGRLCTSFNLPFTGIRGIGIIENPIPIIFGIKLNEGLLVITNTNQLMLMTPPDYFAENPTATNLRPLIDFRRIVELIGFLPTDVAQSPVAPYHIFVSGFKGFHNLPAYAGMDMAESQIHEFDTDGSYLGKVFTTRTVRQLAGHLSDIEFLSNGQLLGLMATANDARTTGIHKIDLSNDSSNLLIRGEINLASMSVMRGETEQEKDIVFVVDDDTSVGFEDSNQKPTTIKRFNTFGHQIDFIAFVAETISAPGEPGMLRFDGSVPTTNVPTIKFDGFQIPNLSYPINSNRKATFNSPTIGSLSGSVITTTGMENLVIGRHELIGNDVTLYCQGAEEGQSVYVNINDQDEILSRLAGPSGQLEVTVPLDLGFNNAWVETNEGGDTHELLKRHVLLIQTPLPRPIISITEPFPFGRVKVGNSVTRRLVIHNQGDVELRWHLLIQNGIQFMYDPVLSNWQTLAANSSQEVTIVFEPTSSGYHTDNIKIENNARDINVSLFGTGYIPSGEYRAPTRPE